MATVWPMKPVPKGHECYLMLISINMNTSDRSVMKIIIVIVLVSCYDNHFYLLPCNSKFVLHTLPGYCLVIF
jgi:hypothetical protein